MTAALLASVLAATAWACCRGGLRARVVADRIPLVPATVGAPRRRPRRARASLRARAARRSAVERLAVAAAEEVRAGAPPREAVRRAASASADPQLRSLAVSEDPASLLPPLAAAPGGEGLTAVGSALRLAATLGAAPAPLLDAVARAVRDEAAQQRLVDGELATAVATARLLAGLPLLGVLMGYALGADPLGVLLTSTPGRACLAAALALEGAGIAWAARIRRRALG